MKVSNVKHIMQSAPDYPHRKIKSIMHFSFKGGAWDWNEDIGKAERLHIVIDYSTREVVRNFNNYSPKLIGVWQVKYK